MNDPEIRGARERVESSMGRDFAAKASDELLLALAPPPGGPHRGIVRGTRGLRPVVELDLQPLPPTDATAAVRQLQETREWKEVVDRARAVLAGGEVGIPGLADALLRPAGRLRDLHVREMRERCYRAMEPVAEQLRPPPEPRQTLRGGAALPGAALSTAPGEVCWLNQTIRAAADPTRMRGIASDPRVRGFRVGRRLVRDLRTTSRTVGAVQHREATGHGGKGILVAVIDTEVDRGHPAFGDRVVQRMNYTVEPWGNPGEHGTAIAGIIAAGGPELFGMAPEAVVYNYKVLAAREGLEDGEDFDLACALQQALEDGVHVANCSLSALDPEPAYIERLVLACRNACALGMTIVKSAGNMGPAPGSVAPPAGAPGVIVVGATGRTGLCVERYSSRGPVEGVEFCPDLVAPGGSDIEPIESCLVGGRTGPAGWGTSHAAAHVSGLLALLLEAEPDLTPPEQRERLFALCDPAVQGGAHVEGRGIVRLAR